jgi:hypothetical protein
MDVAYVCFFVTFAFTLTRRSFEQPYDAPFLPPQDGLGFQASSEAIPTRFSPAQFAPVVDLTNRLRVHPAAAQEADSDVDAEGETDDDCNSDDEYIPIPNSPRRSSKRRVASSTRYRVVSRSSPNSASSSSPSPSKRQRAAPPSRNVQIDAITESIPDDFTCPHCGWKQTNRRQPDFLRHVRTHKRPSPDNHYRGWWCKGVPVSQGKSYGVESDARQYEFQGKMRTGGCLSTFSRRDALKRHLDNHNQSCVGRPVGACED